MTILSLIMMRNASVCQVAGCESEAHRRLLVRPSITGSWRVSGRSTLSWEDTVRLDLYDLENWSLAGDLVILWLTARAVLRSHGAY